MADDPEDERSGSDDLVLGFKIEKLRTCARSLSAEDRTRFQLGFSYLRTKWRNNRKGNNWSRNDGYFEFSKIKIFSTKKILWAEYQKKVEVPV